MSTVYLNSFKQISVQKPLSEDWINNPQNFENQKLVRTQDPDFKSLLPANVCRRNGNILKRAMIVSNFALKESGLESVEAVVVGSGLGCVENTELFLQELVYEGEEFMKPSYFMASTHNTISSTIGINLGCHGYNSTYCHKGVSFENALLDVFLQIQMNRIKSAFVGGFDEMSPTYFNILQNAGYFGGDSKGFAGEASAGGILSNKLTDNTLCRVVAVRLGFMLNDGELLDLLDVALQDAGLQKSDISAVMTGINGKPSSDAIYHKNLELFGIQAPTLGYAHLFGESYSGSVYGFYASAVSLHQNKIPQVLFLDKEVENQSVQNPKNILIYHHFNNKDHSFIILQRC